MQAFIYRSQAKADTYVFLARDAGFEHLPPALHAQLAPFAHVMTIELTPERALARGNAAEVHANLLARGFHLQLPPSVNIDPMTSDWGTDA